MAHTNTKFAFLLALLVALLIAASLAPAVAQDDLTEVDYVGIHFAYESSLAADVNAEEVEAVPLQEGYPFWEATPAHILFRFEGFAGLEDSFHNAVIRVYRAADFDTFGYAESDSQYTPPGQIERLKELVAEQPALAPFAELPTTSGETWLPFLPLFNAAQVFRAQPAYVEFEGGMGIRYLTYYSQAVDPIVDSAIFYTFQGITDDGEYYISAILPVNTGLFPEEIDYDTFDFEAFVETFTTYLQDSLDALNAQPADEFSPSLGFLDAMLATLTISE